MWPGGTNGEEIATEFNVITKDYEVTELGQVSVEQVTIEKSTISWTLNEIDYYIEAYGESIKQYQKAVKDMQELRANIEAEAIKVRLSVGEKSL
jgi:hypothetical protein